MRSFFIRSIQRAKRALYLLTKGLIAESIAMEGQLLNNGPRIRVLFIGHGVFNKDFERRIFEKDATITRHTKIFVLTLRKHISKHRTTCDICVIALPSAYDFLFYRVDALKGPEFVQQIIDTSHGWDGVRKNASRAKRTLVNTFEKKHQLNMKLSTDLADLDFFYHRMFLPYMTKRFGSVAIIDSYSEMKSFFRDGILLFIVQNGRPVTAALCRVKEKRLIYLRAGALDGDDAIVSSGALAAIYYYQIKYAIENKFAAVDCMQSRPFLNDGVYHYKAGWGAQPLPYFGSGASIHYVAPKHSASLAHLFQLCPIITCVSGKLHAIIGYAKSNEPSEHEIEDHLRKFYLTGVQGVTIITNNTRTERVIGI